MKFLTYFDFVARFTDRIGPSQASMPWLLVLLALISNSSYANQQVKIVFSHYEGLALNGIPSCSSLVSGIDFPKTTEVSWIGETAPAVFFDNLFSSPEAHSLVQKTDTLLRIDFAHFQTIFEGRIISRNGKLYFTDSEYGTDVGEMRIEPNGSYEESIIQHSYKNDGREALGVRVIEADGSEEEILICQKSNCGPTSEARFWLGSVQRVEMPHYKIDAMIAKFQAKGSPVSMIDITHTHPTVQFRRESRVRADGKKLLVIFPFNDVDLRYIEEMSLRHPTIKFRGRAVTPDGFNYSVTYLNGKPLE